MDTPMTIIADLTKTDEQKRRRLFRWFSKQPAATQLEADRPDGQELPPAQRARAPA